MWLTILKLDLSVCGLSLLCAFEFNESIIGRHRIPVDASGPRFATRGSGRRDQIPVALLVEAALHTRRAIFASVSSRIKYYLDQEGTDCMMLQR